MGAKWKVTLFNQHAQSGISAEGRTRRAAFDKAFNRAGPAFRHHKLAEMYKSAQGADVMWLAAFNDAKATMRHGTQAATLTDPHGFAVEIRRIDTFNAWRYV